MLHEDDARTHEVAHDEVAQDVVGRWCRAAEGGDAAAAATCLAPDVELVSPLTAQFSFRGRESVGDLFAAAFGVIEDIRIHTRIGEGGVHALFFRAHVGTQELEEAQLLELDGDGLVGRITLFGRPLPALTAVMAALGPELARRQSRPALAAFLAASTAPLHAAIRLGDRRVVPLAAPPA